ncbi:helix-turn-helix protein [compost metagenome]
MNIKIHFGRALREFRQVRGLSQEDFSDVSGRTYLSCLERGLKSPTVDKLDALASALGIHAVTLLAYSYQLAEPGVSQVQLMERVKAELALVSTESLPAAGARQHR